MFLFSKILSSPYIKVEHDISFIFKEFQKEPSRLHSRNIFREFSKISARKQKQRFSFSNFFAIGNFRLYLSKPLA